MKFLSWFVIEYVSEVFCAFVLFWSFWNTYTSRRFFGTILRYCFLILRLLLYWCSAKSDLFRDFSLFYVFFCCLIIFNLFNNVFDKRLFFFMIRYQWLRTLNIPNSICLFKHTISKWFFRIKFMITEYSPISVLLCLFLSSLIIIHNIFFP